VVKDRPLKLRNAPVRAKQGGSLGLYLLAGAAFVGWFLQFFTGMFETWPALGVTVAGVVGLLGVAVAVQAAREPDAGWRALGLVSGGLVAIGAFWAVSAKGSYSGTLQSHPRYSAPHFRAAAPAGTRIVRLKTADGLGIDGTYFAGNQAGAIIVYPGWVSGKDGFAVSSLARWLAPQFQILVLDPRGVGGSGGFQRGVGDGRLDIRAAAEFLREKGATAIGVLAEGDTALAAALAAADPDAPAAGRIDALALASPTSSWGEAPGTRLNWYDDPRSAFGHTYWRVAAGIRLARGQGPVLAEILPRVSPRPLLVLGHGGESGKAAQQLYMAASEPRGLRILPGSGWPVDWAGYPAYHAAVRDWFRKVLAAPAPAPATTASAVTGNGMAAGSSTGAGSAAASAAAQAPTPTPEELQIKQILAEPQPIVPSLPAPPGSAAQAPLAPTLPPPPPAQNLPPNLPPPPAGR
jgi:hypothetical protein